MMDKDSKLIFEAYSDNRPDVPEFDAAADNPDAIAMFHKTLKESGFVRDEDFEKETFRNEPGHTAYTLEGPPQRIYGWKPKITVAVLQVEDKRPNVDRPEFDRWEDSRPEKMELKDALARLADVGNKYIEYVHKHPEYLHGIGFRVMVSIMNPKNPYSPSFRPDEETGLHAHSSDEIFEREVESADDVLDILMYITKAAEEMAGGPYEGEPFRPVTDDLPEKGVFDD